MESLVLILIFLVPLLAWYGYLIFLGWVLTKTEGKAEALRDAAVAARAFPFRPLAWIGDRWSERRTTPRRETAEERHLNALPSEAERLPRRPA